MEVRNVQHCAEVIDGDLDLVSRSQRLNARKCRVQRLSNGGEFEVLDRNPVDLVE
ncbi:MAG: hypothetical protein AB7N29_09045 [Vicinamibacterales bacterium]